MTPSVRDAVQSWQAELAAIRQDIHAHPELGMEEERTSALVAEKLRGWGIEVHTGVGRLGVAISPMNGLRLRCTCFRPGDKRQRQTNMMVLGLR